MPRSLGTAVENNFTGGLVTEATALNFPENAVTYTTNCVFDKTGHVSRRGAINMEPNAGYHPSTLSTNAVSMFLWRTVSNNGSLVFVVVQVGNLLHFYKSMNDSLSTGKQSFIYDLNTYTTDSSNVSKFECQYAMGSGNLFVVHPYCDPVYVKYDQVTQQFSVIRIDINTRDFLGQPPDNPIDTRPLELSNYHKYNLINQGWGMDQINTFKNDVGSYPSDVDVWWLLKDSNGNFKPGRIEMKEAQKDKLITIYGDVRANSIYRGNTPAPKGHVYLNTFYQDLSFSGIDGLMLTTSKGLRPSSVTFFTGRAFYSGVNAVGYTDKIYFTQILERPEQYGKCYQENDPTSETSFNLLPSDGGVISIPEAGIIYKLFPIAGTLVVFAANGIWAVTGSTGIGFSASDYTVSKVSSINVISSSSFVDVEGYPAFWNDDGIYMVTPGQTGNIQVTSITEKKIKTFFKGIPLSSKLKARGFYNPTDKTIQWLYKSTDSSSPGLAYIFDSSLNFNTQIEAFYPWTFSLFEAGYNIHIAGLITTFGKTSRLADSVVTSNDTQTVSSLVNGPVVVSTVQEVPVSFEYKYLVFNNNYISFAELDTNGYYDWSGYSYPSEFITGYKLRGDGARDAQTNYLHVYFNSGYGQQFRVQSLWDYSNNRNSNRWSSQQVISGTRGYSDYDSRKLKIRGHGKTVQYRFSSIDGQPFNIQGWVSTDSVNSAA